MKIALAYNEILPAHRYGGVERIVMNLAKWYRRLGHEVFILARQGSQLQEFESAIYPPATADLTQSLPSQIDFIHIHQPHTIKPKLPHLFTIHGNASPGESFFANTNFVSRSHAANHNSAVFIYQGIDQESFSYTEAKQDYYLFLAKAKWRVKNLRTAIAFAHDTKTLLKVIGGTGRSTKYVEYLGFLGDDEGRIDLLARARALLYPTNWNEPCALAPLEAMACGTPVFGSRNGCMPEIVPRSCGVVTDSYSDLLSAHACLSEFRPSACRENIEQNFTAERMAKEYLRLIERILAKGELMQSPGYSLQQQPIFYLYKPTLLNRLEYALRGKI